MNTTPVFSLRKAPGAEALFKLSWWMEDELGQMT